MPEKYKDCIAALHYDFSISQNGGCMQRESMWWLRGWSLLGQLWKTMRGGEHHVWCSLVHPASWAWLLVQAHTLNCAEDCSQECSQAQNRLTFNQSGRSVVQHWWTLTGPVLCSSKNITREVRQNTQEDLSLWSTTPSFRDIIFFSYPWVKLALKCTYSDRKSVV